MQKPNYQNLEEENNVEMNTYQEPIPVGQPVSPYVPSHPQQQQHYQHHPPPPQHYQQHPPPHPHMAPPPVYMAPPPPVAPVSISNYNYPSTLTCPCCKNAVMTVVNLESGNTTYLWCVTIGLCISPLCCCIPFLMESCLDKSHYCPNCGHNIMRKHQKCFEFLGC